MGDRTGEATTGKTRTQETILLEDGSASAFRPVHISPATVPTSAPRAALCLTLSS